MTGSAEFVCPRCPEKRPSVTSLEAHLVEHHMLSAGRAQLEVRTVAQGVPESVSDRADHICPNCQLPFQCDWKAVGAMKEQARRLATVAGIWEARLNGAQIGRPRRIRETFDVNEARRLVGEGMTYEAVARVVGAPNKQAIHRAFVRQGERLQQHRDEKASGNGKVIGP